MTPLANAPFFDWKGESFANYAQAVQLWRQGTNWRPAKRASALMLTMNPVAREGCMAAGIDQILGPDCVRKIMKSLDGNFVPGDWESVYQKVVRSLQVQHASQTIDDYMVRLDVLHRKAESIMQMGGASPQVFAPTPCVRNASLPSSEKALVFGRRAREFGISCGFPTSASTLWAAWRRSSTRCFGADGCGCASGR